MLKTSLEAILFDSDEEGAGGEMGGKAPEGEETSTPTKREKRELAWHDSDDEGLQVDISSKRRLKKLRKKESEIKVSGAEYERRLREQFLKNNAKSLSSMGAHRWTEMSRGSPGQALDSDFESDEEIFQTTSKMVKDSKGSSGGQIAPNKLKITRRTDLTKSKIGNALPQVVKFHPEGELVMVCGYDKTLRLYHMDDDTNPVVGAYHLPKFPLTGGVFTSDGSSAILTGLAKSFWKFDVATGQARNIVLAGRSVNKIHSVVQGGDGYLGLGADNGSVCILDEKTSRITQIVRMNSHTRGVAFHPTKKVVYTADKEAYLYEWDLRNGQCITRFRDEAAVSCSSLALSPDGKRLAVGTQSGVVDFFDTTGPQLSDKITNSIDNLHTTITSMAFHPSSDVLAVGSKHENTAMKLVHVPTYTVYANWPTQKTPIRKPMCFDFSRQGTHLAVGNEYGKVLLFSLDHYHE